MIFIGGGILLFLFVCFGFNWFSILTAIVALYFLTQGLGGSERQCQRFVNYTKKKSKGLRY